MRSSENVRPDRHLSCTLSAGPGKWPSGITPSKRVQRLEDSWEIDGNPAPIIPGFMGPMASFANLSATKTHAALDIHLDYARVSAQRPLTDGRH